ncbi:MAG: hypothetical protein A2Y17_02220 [Clostridiales bacterium GWF2_38_85]|nr:MAG: hypothetical protein A2Y17_02220 [Clostridiales bacterium GWF2_38_85]HBL85015.1 hypothetical protein [Clostridiales bacterium]
MKRLELYGDSILKGVTYSDELQKHKLCRPKYDELNKRGIEVNNNSHMGATINQGYTLLEETLTTCDKDTLVLLEFGGNDCNYNWADVSANPDGEFQPLTPENIFIEKYRAAISYVRKTGASIAVVSLVPLDASKFMNWITRNLNFNNILHWLGDVNMLARWQEHYNVMVNQIAFENNCPIIDIRSEFLKNREYQMLLCSDGIHPTQRGYDIIGKKIMSSVLEYSR